VSLLTNGTADSPVVYNTSAIMVDGHRHMLLHIISCQSVYIALSLLPSKTMSYTYEVALGINGNTMSELRTSVAGAAVAEYPGQVLSCLSGNDFWLSWTSTGVSIGIGSRFGMNAMLQWQDEDTGHDINSVAFASQSLTTWQIATVVGTMCLITVDCASHVLY